MSNKSKSNTGAFGNGLKRNRQPRKKLPPGFRKKKVHGRGENHARAIQNTSKDGAWVPFMRGE